MKKFRIHMTDHDILEEQEAAMALTFLTWGERRELWELVEDRRNTFLKTGRQDTDGHLFNTSKLGESKEVHEEDKSREEHKIRMERQFGSDMTAVKKNINKDTVKKSDTIKRLKDAIERARIRLNDDRQNYTNMENGDKSDTIIGLEGSIQNARIGSSAEKRIPKYVDIIDDNDKFEADLAEAKNDKESNPIIIKYENPLEINKLIPSRENERDLINKDELIPSLVGEDVTEEIELKELTIVQRPTLVTNESIPSMCELCYMTMNDKIALEDHVNKIHIEDKEALERSIRIEDLTYWCLICPLKFLSQNILDTHTNLQHKMLSKTEKTFMCRLCYKQFAYNSHAIQHEQIHKDDQNVLCREITEADLSFDCPEENCSYRFVSNTILKYHISRVHKEKENKQIRKATYNAEMKRYICPLCYWTVKDFDNLQKHVNRFHGDDRALLMTSIRSTDLLFKCEDCDYSFLKQKFLLLHRERKHSHKVLESHVKCNNCNKKLKRYSIKPHMELCKREKTLEVGKVCCKLCSVSFKSTGMFKRHKLYIHEDRSDEIEAFNRDIHPDELVHKCDVCESRFLTKNILFYHKRKSIHLSCILCHTVYKEKKSYKIHVLRHHKSGNEASIIQQGEVDNIEMSFKCQQCDKKMLTATILSYHSRFVHKQRVNKNTLHKDDIRSDRKPNLTCSLCQVTFKDVYIQRSHIRKSHTTQDEIKALDSGYYDKEKLIINCQQCDLRFPTTVIGAFHQKYGHRDEDWQCQYCKKTFPKNKNRGKIFKLHMRSQHSVTDFSEEKRTEDDTYKNFNLIMSVLKGRK